MRIPHECISLMNASLDMRVRYSCILSPRCHGRTHEDLSGHIHEYLTLISRDAFISDMHSWGIRIMYGNSGKCRRRCIVLNYFYWHCTYIHIHIHLNLCTCTCKYLYIHIHPCLYLYTQVSWQWQEEKMVHCSELLLQTLHVYIYTYTHGVATISRLLKIIGLFCKRALQKRPIFSKDTCNFKEPTNRSRPMWIYLHAFVNTCIYMYIHVYIYTHR